MRAPSEAPKGFVHLIEAAPIGMHTEHVLSGSWRVLSHFTFSCWATSNPQSSGFV